MQFNPYDWSKIKLDEYVKKIKKIKDDGLITSPGDIWSIKKFFVLDYCVDGFVRIFRNHFDNWYYVDTHCGTGMIGFKESDLSDQRFPGSPLISAFRSKDSQFTKYFFSDSEQETIEVLEKRLEVLKTDISNCSYELKRRDFSETIEFVKQFSGRNGFFVVIDSIGFKEIRWNLMESLLEIKTADVFFTFMTPVIARHRSIVKDDNNYGESLVQFYGNKRWLDCTEGNDLMKLYKSQIGKFRKHVFDIPVFQSGKQIMYHIIIATNSSGASNVVESARKLTRVHTEMMEGGLKVVTGKTDDLTRWLS